MKPWIHKQEIQQVIAIHFNEGAGGGGYSKMGMV
jgi:hypothetical protein